MVSTSSLIVIARLETFHESCTLLVISINFISYLTLKINLFAYLPNLTLEFVFVLIYKEEKFSWLYKHIIFLKQ